MPKPGAFVCFADPAWTALKAAVFWRGDDYRDVVPAYVRDVRQNGFGSIVCLRDVRCQKLLLKTCNGEQHILLRTPTRAAQVLCAGEDIRVNPFALEVVVDAFPEVETPQRLVRRLADLYRNRRLDGPNREWTVEALRHRDALVAFDLKQIGFIYRDIACFLFGEELVREEWGNPNRTLKNRTIRNVKRGIRMVNGGYRSLLK